MSFFGDFGGLLGGGLGAGLGALLALPTGGLSVGAGAVLGGSLGLGMGNAFSAHEAQDAANAQNVAMADKQMAFQERMSNTAYQRQSADMTAAGINPIVGFGSGAAVPAGAMGRVDVNSPVTSRLVDSALTVASLMNQSKLADAQVANLTVDKATKKETLGMMRQKMRMEGHVYGEVMGAMTGARKVRDWFGGLFGDAVENVGGWLAGPKDPGSWSNGIPNDRVKLRR